MDAITRELRYAYRMLTKNPGSSAVAVLAMALGIGLTVSMYAILNGVFLDGLPFEESERLMHLERNNLSRDIESMEVSQHDFEDWVAQQKSFEGLAGFTGGTFNLADDGLPERYNGNWISPGFLEMLRVDPLLGRSFEPADAEVGAPQVLLLSYQVWQQRYGGDDDVIGRVVRLNSKPATIIGVLPEGFNFPVSEELWMPLMLETAESQRDQTVTLEVFGRLRDGVTLDEASVEMSLIASRLAEEYPETNEGVGVVVQPYIDEFIDDETKILLSVMFAAVLMVLLIACFNVANLLIGRASIRTRELAIRSALGSGRARAILQVLTEAALLALAGALLGLALAHAGLQAFDRALAQTDPPFWMHFGLNAKVLLVTLVVTVGAALVAGLVPALQASRTNVGQLLSDSTRGSTSFRLGRISRALVIAEVAISFALLVGAALTIRSVLAVNSYDLRFEAENLLIARMGLFEGDYPEEQDWLAFYDQVREQVGSKAAVASVAIGTAMPTETQIGSGGTRFERPGEDYEKPIDMPFARWTAISPGYWETLGVKLLAGRDFTDADHADAPPVVIVNEDFARKEWPGENPIGQRVDVYVSEEEELADPEAGVMEVIGVVPDMRFAEFDNEDDQQAIYVPMAQNPARFAWIIAKTRAEPTSFVDSLRRTVLELDAGLPLYYVSSMEQALDRTMFFPNLLWVLFTTFGAVAILLAALGLYGVVAFSVSQRTQEIGVRMAFGAQTHEILRMVLRQGMSKVIIGLVIGLVLAIPMAGILGSTLFQVKAADPVTFVVVPVLLASVAALACLLPARRASSVDPLRALHYE
ncbi:MAG: ABC transporter permease [Acidobacteriota bacterium]